MQETSAERNKAIHRNAYHAAVVERSLDGVRRYMADGLAEELWQGCQVYFAAFPDLHVSVEDVVTEGDKVAARLAWTGTHDGSFGGKAATGRSIAVDSVDIARIREGKIVEFWNLVDLAKLMEQLGAG